MQFSTLAKNNLNRLLGLANLRVETLTRRRAEERRLARLADSGHFARPVFPVPKSFELADVAGLLQALPQFRKRFDTFRDAAANDVRFCFANDYFRSPDVEVLYTLIRTYRPARMIEVGSGNSTKVARQAILDGGLKTHLLSIDPQPRAEVDSLADECVRQPVEQSDPALFDALRDGDILFIDSSHEVRVGNDGAFLYSTILPRLACGVLVQIHDVFLPYDYPADLLENGALGWNEQYVVQAMLAQGGGFAVLWPGHFLQRARADFAGNFPHNTGWRAQSLWLRKISPAES
jgi:hypothetical protein